MKRFDSCHYLKKDTVPVGGDSLTVWDATQPIDDQWDAFLASTPFGHFYQTSKWARARVLDGWKSWITVITREDEIIAGFQILWRVKSPVGKVGLLLKGPVIASDDPQMIAHVISVLKRSAQTNRLKALVIQPPDKGEQIDLSLRQQGFSSSYFNSTIKNNTVLIDLRGSEEEIFKRIKRTKRQNINTAIRKGITVRQGDKEDLETFFTFMTETCKRQQVLPSPSNIDFLYTLWDLFSPGGNITLFLAEYEGEVVTCLIVLTLGGTAYLWKFGWSGKHAKLYPNILIYWEIFKWAKAHGFHFADLGTISPGLAQRIWNGDTATEEMSKTYSYMKTCFGGDVVPLSKGFVYIPNVFLRTAYNILMPLIIKSPVLSRKLLFER
jgi:lipid II:glycine glycyltransferase (peptidoglycan interpeptide bridge formation enzyme)